MGHCISNRRTLRQHVRLPSRCETISFKWLTVYLVYRASKEAEAALYAKQKEAEGIKAMAAAYADLGQALGGGQALLQYLMLQNGLYEKLAKANASAIQGLQPKISVWNTGAESGADSGAPIRNLFQSLPPLLSTIQDQTGITPPNWLAQMGGQQYGNGEVAVVNGKGAKVNGERH